VLYVGHSKNETSKRKIPLNGAACDAITRMLERADELGHAEVAIYLWCASLAPAGSGKVHSQPPVNPARRSPAITAGQRRMMSQMRPDR
jgi:hypothetical protein